MGPTSPPERSTRSGPIQYKEQRAASHEPPRAPQRISLLRVLKHMQISSCVLKHIRDFRNIFLGMQYYPTSAARRYYFGCAAPPRRKVENPFVFPSGRARGAGSANPGTARWRRVGRVTGLDPTFFQNLAFFGSGEVAQSLRSTPRCALPLAGSCGWPVGRPSFLFRSFRGSDLSVGKIDPFWPDPV